MSQHLVHNRNRSCQPNDELSPNVNPYHERVGELPKKPGALNPNSNHNPNLDRNPNRDPNLNP